MDSHLEFCLIQNNIKLDDNEQIKAYFNNQELCLPIDKNVDLYQAVFKDSNSQYWMICYRENVYKLKDLSFYDLRGIDIKSFHAPLFSQIGQLSII